MTKSLKRNLSSVMAATAAMTLASCGATRQSIPAAEIAPTVAAVAVPSLSSAPHSALPKAVIYRMSGPYDQNVAITLSPDGSVASYPAPSDLSVNSAPVDLGDGWYLSRCGISPASVFTTYTYHRYSTLKKAPTPQELLDSVIPGAVPISLTVLPITQSEALENPDYARKFIPKIALPTRP